MLNKSIERQKSAKWAFELLDRPNWIIVDAETTGLDTDSQICQLAVIAPDSSPLMKTFVKPTCPIDPGATQVHGINDEAVATAPYFDEVLLWLMKSASRGDVIFYNAELYLRMIRQSIAPYGIHLAFPMSDRRQSRVFFNGGSIHCAMKQYSRWIGEWNASYGDWKWQGLPQAKRDALEDCRVILGLIRKMAQSYDPELLQSSDDVIF